MTTVLEICAETLDGVRAARDGGADRVELCAALAVGGVTPSIGVTEAALAIGLPIHVLIRPGAGDFVHDGLLVEAVARDIRAFAKLGVAGIVVGALTVERRLDLDALGYWRDAARGIAMTLHRAIDLCVSPVAAVAGATTLGIDRILTSGGARTAMAGAAAIAAMVGAAAGRIEIMAGAGIDPGNVRALVAVTGVPAVHASAGKPRPWTDPRVADFGFGPPVLRQADAHTVRALRAALAAADQRP